MRKPFVVLAITLLTLVLVGGAALAQTGNLAIWSAASEEEAQALIAEFKKLYPGISVDLIPLVRRAAHQDAGRGPPRR